MKWSGKRNGSMADVQLVQFVNSEAQPFWFRSMLVFFCVFLLYRSVYVIDKINSLNYLRNLCGSVFEWIPSVSARPPIFCGGLHNVKMEKTLGQFECRISPRLCCVMCG